jgi:rod shape-determining protein MreD
MRYAVAITTAFFLAILSVSAMPYVKILGVTPDFVLIFAVCWAVVRGQDEALIVVPAAGFIRDLTTSDPVGTSVLAMIPIVLFAAAIRFRTIDSEFPPAIVVTVLASVTYGIISMAVLAATGQHIDLFDALVRVVLPSAVVNALFCPIVYLPVRWLSPPPGPAILGRRRITSPL